MNIDRLTQLQNAIDQVRFVIKLMHPAPANPVCLQLAHQLVAGLHFVNWRHDLEVLGPNDSIRDVKQEPGYQEGPVYFCRIISKSLY